MKFLEKDELSNYTFQNDFMRPFVVVMRQSQVWLAYGGRGLRADWRSQEFLSHVPVGFGLVPRRQSLSTGCANAVLLSIQLVPMHTATNKGAGHEPELFAALHAVGYTHACSCR